MLSRQDAKDVKKYKNKSDNRRGAEIAEEAQRKALTAKAQRKAAKKF